VDVKDVEEFRREADGAPSGEVAYAYRDATIDEIAALYRASRRQRKDIDFSAATNLTHEGDLAVALRHIGDKVAATLTAADVDACRIAMLKAGHRPRTVRNAGMALRRRAAAGRGRPDGEAAAADSRRHAQAPPAKDAQEDRMGGNSRPPPLRPAHVERWHAAERRWPRRPNLASKITLWQRRWVVSSRS
jgi:hypothetical protein